MTEKECGAALVAVYVNGARECTLRHPHDGGEAYMRPLIRRGIAYAKTHYDSGEIVDVLLAEPEMLREPDVTCAATLAGVRHVYYVLVKPVPDEGRKIYAALAIHADSPTAADVPDFEADIPAGARPIA